MCILVCIFHWFIVGQGFLNKHFWLGLNCFKNVGAEIKRVLPGAPLLEKWSDDCEWNAGMPLTSCHFFRFHFVGLSTNLQTFLQVEIMVVVEVYWNLIFCRSSFILYILICRIQIVIFCWVNAIVTILNNTVHS